MALGLLFAAPFLSGAKPPYIWGFLLAAVFLAVVAAEAVGTPELPPGRMLLELFRRPLGWIHGALAGLILCACLHWLVRGWALPDGPASSLSTPGLVFAWAFLGAWLLGVRFGLRTRMLLAALSLLWLGALLCALWSVGAWWLRWPAEYFGWPLNLQRPSGPFMNANRFAVHLSMGLFCGLALWAVLWRLKRREAGGRRVFDAILLSGCGLIFVALCMTLSRLTILAVGLALGLGVVLWIVRRMRRHRVGQRHGLQGANRAWTHRLRLPALFLLLFGLTGAFISLAHLIGQRELAVRYAEAPSELEPDYYGRKRVMKLGLQLVLREPIGRGLGSFENAYREVQPREDTLRWCEVHNDWLQIAIELGLPGFALLATAFAAWWALWWSSLRRHGFRFYLSMPLGLAILVPAFCSLADFPLREPATGLQFFFLAGALAVWLGRSRRTQPFARPDRLSAWDTTPARALAPALLSLISICCAVYALRIGHATWSSPWRGCIYPPAPDAGQVGAYREAVARAPRFQPLLVAYGLCLSRQIEREPGNESAIEELIRVADRIERIDPLNARAPLFRATAAVLQSRADDAVREAERAVERVPSHRDVRQAAIAILMRALYEDRSARLRALCLERLYVHMRFLLSVQPDLETRFVANLKDLRLTPDQIADLWPPDDPASRIPRARFWARERDWLRLDDELFAFSEEDRESPWFAAWQGRSQLYYGDTQRGLANWHRAIAAHETRDAAELRRWMGQEARHLPPPLTARWVQESRDAIARDAALVLQIAPWLADRGQALCAESLMQIAVRSSPTPEIYRFAAELARRLNDHPEALQRARLAWNLSDKGPQWSAWLAEFERRAVQK